MQTNGIKLLRRKLKATNLFISSQQTALSVTYLAFAGLPVFMASMYNAASSAKDAAGKASA